MFCSNCGKEIRAGSAFCPYCGTRVDRGPYGGPSVGDTIDRAGEEIGRGIDDAVNEMRNHVNRFTRSRRTNTSSGRAYSSSADGYSDTYSSSGNTYSSYEGSYSDPGEAYAYSGGDGMDDGPGNWRDYITPQNMEILAAITLFIPLCMAIVSGVVSGTFRPMTYIPGIGFIFGVVPWVVRILFVIAAGAGVASAVYLIVKEPYKRTVWSYITLGGTVLAFLSCLGIMFKWEAVPFIFGLIALIWGIDTFSRIVIQKAGMESTPDLGNDLGAYSGWYQDYRAAHPSPSKADEDRIAYDPNASCFDGTGGTLFGLLILTCIVSAVTCGIGTPWFLCKIYRWRKEHTVINGQRLRFTGTGGELLGHWIIWEILCIITCGIYSFFMYVALKKWELKHTEYEVQPGYEGQFDGNSFEYLGYGLLAGLLITVSCGLAAPWMITMILKWEMKHSVVTGDRMRYEGTALGILGQYIIVFLLSLITLGIYSAWGIVRLNKYIYGHTNVDPGWSAGPYA